LHNFGPAKAKPQTPPLYCYRRRENRRPWYHDRATRRRRLGGSCNQRLVSGKFGESTIIQLSRFRIVMVPVARVLTEPHSADPCAVASDIADLIRAVLASPSPLSAAGPADAGQSRALGILAMTHPHSPAYSGRASPARNCHDRKATKANKPAYPHRWSIARPRPSAGRAVLQPQLARHRRHSWQVRRPR
jgi:hypothetical protein